MFAVVITDRGMYLIKSNYSAADHIPDGWQVVKCFFDRQQAEDYKNECVADQYLQREEQRAADRCYER